MLPSDRAEAFSHLPAPCLLPSLHTLLFTLILPTGLTASIPHMLSRHVAPL